MSDNPAAQGEDGSAKGAKKKKGPGFSNLLLVIIGLANFLGVAGVGAYLVYGAGHSPQAAAQPEKSKGEHAEGDEAAAEEGEEPAEAGGHGGGHGEKAEPAAEGHGEAGKEGHTKPAVAGGGPLLPLETIVTNLSEPDNDRYLKITVQLRITSEAARPEVEAHLVPIRSQILLFFSSLTVADMRGAEAKQILQARVKRLANETMPTSRITQVYFTELVIQ